MALLDKIKEKLDSLVEKTDDLAKTKVTGGQSASYFPTVGKVAYHIKAHNTAIFLVIAAVFHFMHVMRLGGAYGPSDPMFFLYVLVLPALAAMLFFKDPDGPSIPVKSLLGFMILGAVSYYIPVLLNWLVLKNPKLITFASLALFAAPGWIIFVFLNPGDSKITRTLATIFFVIWTIIILLLLVRAQLVKVDDITAPTLISLSNVREATAQIWLSFKGVAVEAPKQAFTNTQTFFKGQIAQATDPQYTGSVDQTEGQPIGVYITDAQPLAQRFDTTVDDVVVLAIMKARTFSDNITVNNKCYIKYTDNLFSATEQQKGGNLYPPKVTVDFTGAFQDKYDLECTIDNEDIRDVRGQFVTGTVHFNSTFDFETLGYATYSFMDRDLISAFRLENTDPATVLGVPRTLQPKYTSGPLQIGMPQDTMPIAYEGPEQNLPTFGVTFTNAWFGKGGVEEFEKVEFAIPEPFELVTEAACTGGSTGKVAISRVGPKEDNRRYIIYRVNEPELLRAPAGQNYITIRCRVRVDPLSSYGVLGTSGAGIYTFSVSTKYRYTLETRAPVTLRGPGASANYDAICISDTVQCSSGSTCTCRAQDSAGFTYRCSFNVGNQNQKTCTVIA